MARNTLRLNTTGFESMLKRLDELGGDVKVAVEKSLSQAAKKITADTETAIDSANLPAQGKYSRGETKESIIRDSQVYWEGQVGWVPVGFDFSKPGAGGYLITGTPRMRPDAVLAKIYKQKKYMNQIQKEMGEVITDFVIEKMTEG